VVEEEAPEVVAETEAVEVPAEEGDGTEAPAAILLKEQKHKKNKVMVHNVMPKGGN